MPANLNPQVVELLSWHGHAAGGVHVPFQERPNPMGQVIETALVRRLRALAAEIAANPASRPRWIFLVGGPGNGKSETVQDFLTHLDSSLGIGGALTAALRREYTRAGIVPRKVEILPNNLQTGAAHFSGKIGRLLVIQDATATETAAGNAAKELAEDLADLITSPTTPPLPVFVACANRGLLARAMNEAVRIFGAENSVTQLLANVIQASSLGLETLAGRKRCWPLESDNRFACWPLDVESLLVAGAATPPFDSIVSRAVEIGRWETAGRCQDCSSREVCPIRQNAEWLRADATRANLLTILRRGELARGQRWNFRDSFSLVAELLVGQWSDFEPESHPCQWVHLHSNSATTVPPDASSVFAIAMRLYPYGMFRGGDTRQAAGAFLDKCASMQHSQPLTWKLLTGFAAAGIHASSKPIRDILSAYYVRLDPATYTPIDPQHVIRVIEDAFCQSVELGRAAFQERSPAASEDRLLELMEKAEQEWDVLGRESATATTAVCLLRKIASGIAKRSAGLRFGHHALDDHLAAYEASLRDPVFLGAIRDTLKPLLGDSGPHFNILEIIGQPTAERQPFVSLEGPPPGITPVPAPVGNESTPGHDVPCIAFTSPNYRVPLTFDFFMALRLRKDGCAGSSLPSSVRAALDRVRHRFAGELCRNDGFFVDGRAFIRLGSGQKISLPEQGGLPTLTTN